MSFLAHAYVAYHTYRIVGSGISCVERDVFHGIIGER